MRFSPLFQNHAALSAAPIPEYAQSGRSVKSALQYHFQDRFQYALHLLFRDAILQIFVKDKFQNRRFAQIAQIAHVSRPVRPGWPTDIDRLASLAPLASTAFYISTIHALFTSNPFVTTIDSGNIITTIKTSEVSSLQ